MRKYVIALMVVVVCAMAFVSPAQAQTKTEIGIKGGFGFANLTGDVTGTKSALSLGGGGLIRFPLSPQFSIQPELLLILKGTMEKGDDGEKLKLTYIEVPILAMYRPPTKGTVRPVFFTGPVLGLLLSAKVGDDDIKESLNGTDFGLVFGAGVDFETGAKGKIFLEARYTMGISNIAKDSGDDSVKNGVFSLGVSYLLPLGQ
ncbi:MAG: PorT family protein [candidate division Zixibacteria bacterium]|nr:PorT family protein [candidate division Zixibacteria bacterium]